MNLSEIPNRNDRFFGPTQLHRDSLGSKLMTPIFGQRTCDNVNESVSGTISNGRYGIEYVYVKMFISRL